VDADTGCIMCSYTVGVFPCMIAPLSGCSEIINGNENKITVGE